MARKLGLALIIGGVIGAYAGFWNLNNASEISKRIRNEYASNLSIEKNMDIERSPKMQLNSAYGGFSAAVTFASILALASGGYLVVKGKFFDSD